ncbi:MAG: helix-turn-helix domain-containing protein [Planctomycetes bacterium]|nr:helix-turn-helix domain-containing protein [Planctomycetota bacterium]
MMLTIKQAAEKLGVSAGLVYGLCAAGKIRHERFGLGRGTIRIPDEAMDEFRQGCTKETAASVPTTSKPIRSTQQFRHLKL